MPLKRKRAPRKRKKSTLLIDPIRKLLEKMKKSGMAQPIRAQPTPEVTKQKDLYHYLAQITWHSVKDWGKKVYIDTKYRGVRAIIIVDPDDKEIRIYSRNLKPLKKFKLKYGDKIIADFDEEKIDEPTMIDAELFATKKGKPLPQPIETGWAKNPQGYPDVEPSIRVFDVLVYDGKDVHQLPLKKRKELLKKMLDHEGGILKLAESKLVPNTLKEIEKRFREVVAQKHEGIVIKDPNEPYFFGKGKGNWRKMKAYETPDLRLKAVENYPTGKAFWFYKHWILTPEDAPNHEISADKGIRAANMNQEFYIDFTKWVLELWKKGLVKGTGRVPVDNKTVIYDGKRRTLRAIYGMDFVPARIEFPKKLQKIVELYVEDMTPNLIPSGQKIVGFRDDKKKADTLSTLKAIYETWYS